ncbi:hypothetical protein [Candidatus Manganitrophus noduliformans]|uniref:Uncharacterized protein n=1 Tax=Candidatus Manganitrophus noduliformans TaxID=2606439 RepID=A0A7X6DMB7_9BACT|nr:hypothetical protein [Candidatus Manganitrophus noduliformans]NKE69871.1 hypothetical protein [Candidatus Manganitrophus noduliformans]
MKKTKKWEKYECHSTSYGYPDTGAAYITDADGKIVAEIDADGTLHGRLSKAEVAAIVNANRGLSWSDEDFPVVLQRYFT